MTQYIPKSELAYCMPVIMQIFFGWSLVASETIPFQLDEDGGGIEITLFTVETQ